MAQLASLLVPIGDLPKPDTSWIGNIANSLGGVIDEAGQRKSFGALADRIGGAPVPEQQQGGFLSRLMGGNQQASQRPMTAPVTPVSRGPLPASFQSAVDRTEGAGSYDTLFGHAQKNGPFAGTAISQMPIKDVLAFTDPSGQYAQYVKGQVGRVATPVGKYQVVGTTLRNAVGALGLDPNAPFDQGAQDQVASYLARNRISQASTVPGQIRALRAEWEGFKNVPDSEMAQIVQDLQNGTGVSSAGAPSAYAPNEVASLDPSIGIPMPGAAGQMRASAPAQAAPPAQTAGYVDQQVTTAAQQPLMQPQAPVQAAAPQQVADNGAPSIIAPGITPIQRGGVDPAMIQFMLRDPNLRQAGLQLWQQNATGKTSEPWQFVTLPDGTLARANQQTGQIEKVGQFSKPQDPISVSEGETLLDPVTKQPIYQGQSNKPPVIQEFFDEQTGKPYKAQFDPQTREWKRIGGVKANDTAGQQDYEYAIQQLRERGVPEDKLPTFQEYSKPKSRGISFRDANGTEIQIGGDVDGGSYSGTSLPAEVGARIGLGDNFIKNDYPDVIKMIKNGDATGPIDYAKGVLGRGNSGIVQRRMASGADALRRGLTGAGMSASESEEYARRYLPQPTDDTETLLRKAEGLKADLESVTSGAIKGKAGDVGGFLDKKAAPPKPGNAADLDAARDAIRRGAPRDKVIERLKAAGIDTEGL